MALLGSCARVTASSYPTQSFFPAFKCNCFLFNIDGVIVRLVERTTLMMVLARMPGVTNQSALDGFSEAISVIPAELCKTFICYQGREMSMHN